MSEQQTQSRMANKKPAVRKTKQPNKKRRPLAVWKRF